MPSGALYPYIPLIGSMFVAVLGFFVWLKKPRQLLQVVFFLYCLTISIWLFGTFKLFSAHTDADAIFWDRVIYVGVAFIPIFLYHFGIIYGNVKKQDTVLCLGYVLSLVFLPLTQSDYFVSGLFHYAWGVHTRAQTLHHFFLVYFFFYFALFFINLGAHYKRSNAERRAQVLPVLIGFAILDLIGPLAFLPAYGISIYPAVFLSAIPFALVVAYAIIRHNALDLKTISTEIFVTLIIPIVGIELFFARSKSEFGLRFGALVFVTLFSVMLVRSVKNEVTRREEVQKLAEQLETANTRLTELDRAKSEFISIAAHQLRTPLSVIKGYLSLIFEGSYGAVSAALKEILEKMNQNNERLIRLVDDFLDVTRIESGRTQYKFEPARIEEIVERMADEFQSKAEAKGLQLVFEPPKSPLPKVKIDADKIMHALNNFIDNAIKYTEKGKVTVRVRRERHTVAVTVKDTGVGMDEADRQNVFQKFYRGKAVSARFGPGTGLGLYVAKRFVEAHKGEIFAESKGAGKGSTFGFKIPIAQ